jgi:hypothetical protein
MLLVTLCCDVNHLFYGVVHLTSPRLLAPFLDLANPCNQIQHKFG